MSTIYVTTGLGQTTTPMRRALRLFEKCLSMLCEWQQRNALRGVMYGLSDRELQDIGTTRGEIEYVALGEGQLRGILDQSRLSAMLIRPTARR
jgi:uncharacterized protein YjiS (DUF1127 family)